MERKKIAVALMIVIVAAALMWICFNNVVCGVGMAFVGCVFVANRHYARCPYCGSWRTSAKRSFVGDDHHPGFGTIFWDRHCRRCQKSSSICAYPGRALDD